jgi:alkanesulfonate monooxygenase
MGKSSQVRVGWFCPTNGDRSAFGDPDKAIPRSLDNFLEVTAAAEQAGMEYMLIPVGPTCWEAWTSASFIAARQSKIKPLVAIKPGFIHPVAQAKMIATFSQFTGGRLYLNLIAGISEKEAAAEGQLASKEARYRQLEEEVVLIKRLLTEKNVKFEGEFYQVNEPAIIPEMPNGKAPEFFLGGGSDQALGISARHSAVHLFWGDYPEVIAGQIKHIKELARGYGREQEIEFAMRLQIICRETEEEAWEFANQLVEGTEAQRSVKSERDTHADSVANQRQKVLAQVGSKLTPHLWTGINEVRMGAGVAVVGNPRQVADQLKEFIAAGCSGFCLSGYPHANEAEIFGRLVMPLLQN